MNCPKCKSENVRETLFSIFYNYKCGSCKYRFSEELLRRVCVVCDEQAVGKDLCAKCEALRDKAYDEDDAEAKYVFKYGVSNGMAWYKRARNMMIDKEVQKQFVAQLKEAARLNRENSKLKDRIDKRMRK